MRAPFMKNNIADVRKSSKPPRRISRLPLRFGSHLVFAPAKCLGRPSYFDPSWFLKSSEALMDRHLYTCVLFDAPPSLSETKCFSYLLQF